MGEKNGDGISLQMDCYIQAENAFERWVCGSGSGFTWVVLLVVLFLILVFLVMLASFVYGKLRAKK